MIELKVLGAGQEVGRSGFLVDTGVEKFLLDYGLSTQNMAIPLEAPINLDAVFLSHAHLDHCGMVPSLYTRGYTGKVYGTKTTLDIATLLLMDAIKVQRLKGIEPYYHTHDVATFHHLYKKVGFGEKLDFVVSSVQLRDAGHIPGSSTILIEAHGKKLLYTGDIKYTDTPLMKGMDTDFKDIDLLICESTYSSKNHPDREKLKHRLIEKIKETMERGGTILLPSFAVARTQEVLLMVYNLGYPVYMDGMGIDVTKEMLHEKEAVSDHEKLKEAFGSANKIKKSTQRKDVLKKPSIVIASAGMLQAGPIHSYIQKLYNREDCRLILTGYQAEGTPGRALLDKKVFTINGEHLNVKMDVEFMDFSAHIGRDDLLKFIEKVNPRIVVPVHGDHTKEFAHELKQKGIEAHALKNGETIRV